MKLKQLLSVFAFCLISVGTLKAQGTTTCPAPVPGTTECYQTSRNSNSPVLPTPNNNLLWNHAPIPNQDCCNAIPLCQPYNVIENGILVPEGAETFGSPFFPGCVPEELPNPNNTCFSNNEKVTTWFKFQIRPLNIPGSPTAVGSPAGKLRFKIIPKDVLDLPDYDPFTDNGATSYGNTDYDFLLFKIPANLTGDGAACTAIRNSTTFTNPTTLIASCNWTGTRGPTGLFEPGTGTETAMGPATRFNLPLDVKVGDVFYLAIDNFSANTQGFDVDFRGLEAPDEQTAIVNPPPTDSIKIKLVENPKCAERQFKIIFDKPVVCDSVKPGKFTITGLLPNLSIVTIQPDGGCNPGGQDTAFVFTLNMPPNTYDTTLQAFITQDIRDICGNKVLLESAKLRLEFPVPLVFNIDSLKSPSCGVTELSIRFAKKVYCDSIVGSPEKFSILNKGLEFGKVTRVRRANGQACTGTTLDSLYIISFNKAIKDSTSFQLSLNGVVRDFCGNPVALDSLPFRINPFLRLEATKELACPDDRNLTLTAIPDSTYSSLLAEDSVTYRWFDLTSNVELLADADYLNGTIIFLPETNPKSIKINRPSPPVSGAYTYLVEAKDLRNGCIDSSRVTITYGAAPAREVFLCPGDLLDFKPEFLNGLGTRCDFAWYWKNYGEGDTLKTDSTYSMITPGDLFASSQTDSLILGYKLKTDTAAAAKGCIYYLPVKATVCNPPNLVLTKGDSVNNRVFKIRGISNGQYEFKIFNRWGKLIDEGPFPAEGWDPKSKNVVPGNYYYILTPKDANKGKQFTSWFQVNAD
jgi:hypothetical protein